MQSQPLVLAVKNRFVEAGNMPSPTDINHPYKLFFRTWKKLEIKFENNKRKKKKYIPANRPQPQAPISSVVKVRFFWQDMHTCKSRDSNCQPQTSCVPFTTTLHNHLWLYRVYYLFILTLKLICSGIWLHYPPYKSISRDGWRHHPPIKIFFYFIQKFI